MRILALFLITLLSSSAFSAPAVQLEDCKLVRQIDSTFQTTWNAWLASGGRADQDGVIVDQCQTLLDPNNVGRCQVSQNSQDLCSSLGDI